MRALILIISLALGLAIVGLSFAQNNGTKLTATSGATSVQCVDSNSALVDILTTVTTTGSVDSAAILTSIDGGRPTTTGWIEPQDFTHNGRHKMAVASFSQILENGNHTVTTCYVQSGADGRTSKQTCAATSSFTVSCGQTDPCADVEVFGNIIGNGNLCSGQAVPVSVKGSFGEGGSLTVAKDEFSVSIPFRRAGDSCVYHALYFPQSDGSDGAGTYTFTLTGNNNETYSFSANLKCR